MLEEGHTRGKEANDQKEREEEQHWPEGHEERGPGEQTQVVQ